MTRVLLFVIGGLLCPQWGCAQDTSLPSALARCAAVEANGARLACYDALARSVAPLSGTVEAGPTAPAGATTIEVDARRQWTDTRLSVEAGESLVFHASGRVNACATSPCQDSRYGSDVGPDGFTNLPSLTGNGFPDMALIGRIGSGAPFLIGASRTVVAETSGELRLGVNDQVFTFSDNRGSFTVSIGGGSGSGSKTSLSGQDAVEAASKEVICSLSKAPCGLVDALKVYAQSQVGAFNTFCAGSSDSWAQKLFGLVYMSHQGVTWKSPQEFRERILQPAINNWFGTVVLLVPPFSRVTGAGADLYMAHYDPDNHLDYVDEAAFKRDFAAVHAQVCQSPR